MATMLSTDIPALAIFGSAFDNRVLELAKTLSDLSMFPVMVRPVADDPLVKFIEEETWPLKHRPTVQEVIAATQKKIL